jgi:hypothetical protein
MPVPLGVSSLTGVRKSTMIGLAKEHVTDMFFFMYCYSRHIFTLVHQYIKKLLQQGEKTFNSKYYPQKRAFVGHAR